MSKQRQSFKWTKTKTPSPFQLHSSAKNSAKVSTQIPKIINKRSEKALLSKKRLKIGFSALEKAFLILKVSLDDERSADLLQQDNRKTS